MNLDKRLLTKELWQIFHSNSKVNQRTSHPKHGDAKKALPRDRGHSSRLPGRGRCSLLRRPSPVSVPKSVPAPLPPQPPPPPRGHLQRLHSGLRSAGSTGSSHSPSAPAPSTSSPKTAAGGAAPPSRRSSSLGVWELAAPSGRATGSLSVRASFGGSMAGAQVGCHIEAPLPPGGATHWRKRLAPRGPTHAHHVRGRVFEAYARGPAPRQRRNEPIGQWTYFHLEPDRKVWVVLGSRWD